MIGRSNNQNGATMGLIVVCCLILALLTVGLFQVTMIFGGSQELRNSVDAGALNVGKEAVKLKTSTGSGVEQQYNDCVDTKGEIGLTNINRVLAKSFLLNANQHAMSANGFGSGSSSSHASDMANAAQSICDRITEKLKDHNQTDPFFNEFIKKNSLKMFGKAEVKADHTDWDTAFVDRDEESNIRIEKNQMPDGFTLPADATKSIKEKGASSNTDFFKGYHGIEVNSRKLSFVPFKYDEKPHLINGFYFQASKVPVSDWTKPVPNALSTHGSTEKISWNNSAAAYVVSNPQRQYQAAIPHAFIRIKLEKNKAHWKYQGIIPDKETTYGYYPGQVQYHVRDAGSGTMNLVVTLGQQYLTTTLWQAVNAFGTPDNSHVMKALLQRIREIKSDFSMSDLSALLLDPTNTTLGMDEGEFYIVPIYTSADRTNPTFKIMRESTVAAAAPWIKSSAGADGSEKEIDHETRPLFSSPNIVVMTMTGIGCKPGVYGASEEGHLDWTPGTGYDQCLGTLRVHRETTIIYSGACTIL